MMDTLLVATANPGKAREIARLLADLPWRVTDLASVPGLPPCAEDQLSFAANARQKALHYHQLTSLPTLADDSGLMVDALDGAPGVHSARYAGEGATDARRIEKLLRELSRHGSGPHPARFVCAVSFVRYGREWIAVSGECRGVIIAAPRGTGGFGYDPVFLVPELQKTFAELTPQEKAAVSHRGRALARFCRRITQSAF
ncbi:MAG: RdgB/HAM1 family non-canonical purine NTP pyrophosphatase [Acidobacteria bacterium]|nr:RdgB/HAM1 family non-canonical purine NTP pyrophosphatase [Acidobacteriota bacterium]